MSAKDEIKWSSSRVSVYLHVVRIGQWLDIQVPIRLVIRSEVSQVLHNGLVKPFGLAIGLGVVVGGEVMPYPQESAYGIKELCRERLSVIG